MTSGGESPATGGHGGIGGASVSKKGPNRKRTRSAQLGWLTQCYGRVLAAVGEPNNEETVGALWNDLKEFWERYENAHSNYLAEAELSESKLRKLDKQHEDNRRDFCQAQETMRKYLTTGLSPRPAEGTPRDQLLVVDDEVLQRSREEYQQVRDDLDRINIERQFQEQAADLARARLSFYEQKSAERAQRLEQALRVQQKTPSSRSIGQVLQQEPLVSRPGSKPWLTDPPRSPRQHPPLSRDLDEELQAAATASDGRSPGPTPAQGQSALRDVRRHIARSGSVATQTLRKDLTEWRQEIQEQEQASRPAPGQRQQQPKSAPAAPALRVSQQPPRSSLDTAEQESMGAAAGNRAGVQQRSSSRDESRQQQEKTLVKSRATAPPPRPESSSSSSDQDSDSTTGRRHR